MSVRDGHWAHAVPNQGVTDGPVSGVCAELSLGRQGVGVGHWTGAARGEAARRDGTRPNRTDGTHATYRHAESHGGLPTSNVQSTRSPDVDPLYVRTT